MMRLAAIYGGGICSECGYPKQAPAVLHRAALALALHHGPEIAETAELEQALVSRVIQTEGTTFSA